jgi:hypothetical protein
MNPTRPREHDADAGPNLGPFIGVIGYPQADRESTNSTMWFAEPRRHHSLLHLGVAAFGTGDLTGFSLHLKSVAVTKPTFEVVATGAT